ncbi:MAG: YdhR family protein, partial [Planctomycetota bacterium]|nr:YdhR family protein [Planctomycetota bacterium]
EAPWRQLNPGLRNQPGLINKTWLSGLKTQSLGGLYEFNSVESAQSFVNGYFPGEAKRFGVAQSTFLFNGEVVKEASEEMNSVHFGATLAKKPGAYVYTQVQVNVPFEQAPWRDINPKLRELPGFLAKTWLSGLHSHSLGGLYAFDSIENASAFALEEFPKEPAALGAAFTTRIFDAAITEAASKDMNSPFYASALTS